MMKSSINLLPLAYRRRDLLRSRLLQWSLVWIVCAVIAAGIGVVKQGRYRSSLGAMKEARSDYLPLEKLMRERDAARSKLGRLHAKGTLLEHLRERRPILTLLGVVSQSARKCNGRLFVRNLQFEHRQRPAQSDQRQGKDPKKKQETTEEVLPWATVTLEGDALDNLAIATLAAVLRDTGLFRRVELKSSVGKQSGHTAIHSFTVKCEI